MLAFLLLLIVSLPPLLAVELPETPLFAILGVLTALNLVAGRALDANDNDEATLFRHLLLDIGALSALVFFTGGVTNPLISLLLPPVAIAALTLPARRVAAISLIAAGAYATLLFTYLPLRLADPGRATWFHLVGMWLTFALSTGLIAWFIVRMTALIRQREAELSAAREQALRDERVVALGTLAAGAAHELGTPLATMALIAGELAHDTSLPLPVREDIDVLRAQIAACKEIVSGLSRRAGAERLENIALEPVDRWLQRLRERWLALRPGARNDLKVQGTAPAPAVPADPRLEQAVYNLLDNALRAGEPSARPCELALDWDKTRIRLAIRDHGPGIAPELLAQIGREALPPHAGGSGIGLLLTHAAIEQFGGTLTLSNPPDGGALAVIELPIATSQPNS